MLFGVTDVMPQEDFDVALPWMSGRCASKEGLRFLADVLCSVAKVAGTSAYLLSKFFAADAPENLMDPSEPDGFKKEVRDASAVFKHALSITQLIKNTTTNTLATKYNMAGVICFFNGWSDRVVALRPLWGGVLGGGGLGVHQ